MLLHLFGLTLCNLYGIDIIALQCLVTVKHLILKVLQGPPGNPIRHGMLLGKPNQTALSHLTEPQLLVQAGQAGVMIRVPVGILVPVPAPVLKHFLLDSRNIVKSHFSCDGLMFLLH